LQLYSFFRSSAAYRTRIALNLKGVPFETVPIHLTKDGGQQHSPAFHAINPQERVPALAVPGGVLLQSLAIMEYLDEIYPAPPFLPVDAVERAKVRALAQIIACDIHPLNNVGPLSYLRHVLKADTLMAPGPYAFGRQVTVADICLVPQVYNARRFKVPLDRFPGIVAVDAALQKLPAFDAARPENQPDAE
jgi:glutathione S-transferase